MRGIHPFPARMAPDAIVDVLNTLPKTATVLDPMCGSGVVVRLALLSGRQALGFDIDPLAVLMSKVWTANKSLRKAEEYASEIAARAASVRLGDVRLPWIDGCPETRKFVDYWFARPQRNDLRRLSWLLTGGQNELPSHIRDCLWLALSRIIVTKHIGATLAWDVSHSRPHKVRTENDFDVPRQFVRSAARVASLVAEQPLRAAGKIRQADCRALPSLGKVHIDAVITSPPYLNAIDYLRGHKMSLIWMGHTIPELRHIRAISLGTERSRPDTESADTHREIEKALPSIRRLPSRQANLVRKYAADAESMLTEMRRVLRPGGILVTVVGNCNVRGRFIENSKLCAVLAFRQGFHLREQRKRPLTPSRRYLPIVSSSMALERRMKYEVVQVYEVAR
jgi:SAM-dependent methyltransferase